MCARMHLQADIVKTTLVKKINFETILFQNRGVIEINSNFRISALDGRATSGIV